MHNKAGLELRKVQPSATLVVNELSNQLISQGREIYRLGFGQSPFPVPPSIVSELQKHAHHKEYLPVQGLKALRKAISNYYKVELNCHYDPEQIMVGPGSKELLFLIQLVSRTGLLIPAPSWVSYAPQAWLCNKKVHWIHTNESNSWQLTGSLLDQACREQPDCRLLILNYPNNPSGTVPDQGTIQEIAEVASSYNLIVISDEIYSPLYFSEHPASVADYYPEGTIRTNGLSKWCGAGGWRLGTASFPQELSQLLEAVKSAASETFTSVCSPVQYAAISAFNYNQEIKQYVDTCRSILVRIGRHVHDQLLKHNISSSTPLGGFYLFPNFENYRESLASRGILTSIHFCQKLLSEAGVALLPGSDFGRPQQELTCRLAFVDFDGETALKTFQGCSDHNEIEVELMSSVGNRICRGLDEMFFWLEGMSNEN